VVQGELEVAEALLHEKFDTIFFTGSTQVGRRVMAAAARHLTPVTLELGANAHASSAPMRPSRSPPGGSPGASSMNAGQTCVAPDFVLVDPAVWAPAWWRR